MAAGLAGSGVDAVRAGIDDPTLPLPPSFNRFQDAQDAPQGRTRTTNRARRCPRHSGTGWRLTWRGKAELALPLWIVGGANSGLCDLKEIVVSPDGEAARSSRTSGGLLPAQIFVEGGLEIHVASERRRIAER
jgi:hypothetical protein